MPRNGSRSYPGPFSERKPRVTLFKAKERPREKSGDERQFESLFNTFFKEEYGRFPTTEESNSRTSHLSVEEKEELGRGEIKKGSKTVARYEALVADADRPSAEPLVHEAWTPREARQELKGRVEAGTRSTVRKYEAVDEDQRVATQRFGEQVHENVDTLLARIDADIRAAEIAVRNRPTSSRIDQLETLKITRLFLDESRDAQKELDEETRFFYEGMFASFTSEKHKEEKYQKRGTGGIALMLDAVRHARHEVRTLQEREPDKTKRSKLIPKPIEEHELKNWQNRVSQGLRAVLGPTSAVLDTGLVVGLYFSNVMAATGQIVQWTDPVYAFGMLAGLKSVGVTLENMKRTAATDDLMRSKSYLSQREKKTLKKQKVSWKQIRALAATGAYTVLQFEGVLVAVAGAEQGGDLNREIAAAAQNVDQQIERLQLPAGFEAADFADRTSEKYESLTPTARFFADFHQKDLSIITAEDSGSRVEGAGGTGNPGRGRNWGGKYAVLRGVTEVDGPLLASGPTGLAEGMQARAQIAREFSARLQQIRIEEDENENLSERGSNYHDIAEALVTRHFDLHSEVLAPGVSVETQLMAFHNDFIQTIDEPAFVILTNSGSADNAQLTSQIAEILKQDIDYQRLSDEDKHLLQQIQERGGDRVSLRELYVLYKSGAIETGAEVAIWSDDFLDPYLAKISQSFGITPPNRSTLRPHVLRIQDTVPLFEYLQHKLFAERSTILLELVQQELSTFDGPNASADSGITLEVPHVSIDVTPFTEDINTEGGAAWFNWETHHEAFKNWKRACMSLSVLAILLLINFGPVALTRARIQKTEKTRRDEFSERRKQFEGEGDRREGAEYLLAEHVAENLNKLVDSPGLKGIFPNVRFTTDMVQSAMREAAATDEVPVLANSPLSSPDTIMGKVFSAMSRYPHDLKHVVIATDLPEPPAVKAFNHLITLYKDPVALTTRIADQLLPGFANMMETILQNPEFVRKALLSSDQFSAAIQNAEPEEQQQAAALRAKILTEIHEVAIGHHAFAKRYAQTKIEHLTNDAFDEVYANLAEVAEQERGKYLDLTKNPINLLEDNLDAFDANNPGMLETMRESGLRQTIAGALEEELKEAAAIIARADEEIPRLEAEETLDTGLFGKEAARIIKAAQDKRRAKLGRLSRVFSENSDPHIRQFSSTTAVKEQVLQDVERRVKESWYASEEERERTKNWAGIPVKEQLKAIQEASKAEGVYLLSILPIGRGSDPIKARDAGGPFEGVTVEVSIESRKRQRHSFINGKTDQVDISADEGVPQIQVDRHVVSYTFKDREGAQIFKIPVEIRNTLSKVMRKDEIEKKISSWIGKRKEYFSLRVMLDSIDDRAHEAREKNEREIKEIEQRLSRIGFSIPKPKNGETYDFIPVDLSKKGSEQAVGIYIEELLPRLARRTVLADILGKRQSHQNFVDTNLTPNFTAGKLGGSLLERTEKRLRTVSRLYAELTMELAEEGKGGGTKGTLKERVQNELADQVREVVTVLGGVHRELRRMRLSVSFSPRSPEFISVEESPGFLRRSGARVQRIKVIDVLGFLKARRPSARELAIYLRSGGAIFVEEEYRKAA
jgi:hypothetical protein